MRLLHGNRSHRALNKREPKHQTIDAAVPLELEDRPGAPAWLAIARQEWQRIVPTLTATGHVQTSDRAVLLGYAIKYGQWQYFEAEASKAKATVKGSTGQLVQHPLGKAADRSFLLMLKGAVELGLTPATRPRIVAGPRADPPDPFTDFQRRSPKKGA